MDIINNILISNKIPSSKRNYKYFISYADECKIKPPILILPKFSAIVKSYDGGLTKWMYILIEDEELLKKHDYIYNKVSNSTRKEFDSEPVYNKKCLKTKIKSYGDEATDFHYKEIPKFSSNINRFCS